MSSLFPCELLNKNAIYIIIIIIIIEPEQRKIQS